MMVVRRRKDENPPRPERAFSSLLFAEEFIDNDLLHRAEQLNATTRDQCHDIWRRLRADNAPVRVVNKDGLASAPITVFDPLLLSCVQDSWQKVARVVGEALRKSWEDAFLQSGELILSARVIALVELGMLEACGNLMNIQQSEVRPPNHGPEGDANTA